MAKRRNNKPDEQLVDIVEVKDKTQHFFEEKKGMILGVIGLLFVLVLAFLAYKYMFQQPKEKNAKAAIYKAEQQFQRDSFALALENPGGGFEGFLDIIDNYSGTSTANAAKLYAGISYLNLGRYDDAIEYLDAHSASGTYSPIVKNGALGDAYSEKGDMDKAVSYYQKAANADSDALLTPYYLYKLGMLAKKNGNKDKALKAFEKIKDSYPESEEGRKVGRLIAGLSS
ncbi:tetratricopeptide repeat protein [Saprospiraceae bacterium]|nr:tetratricopeptide repeat protein [Saprospiraceae bacterium]